MQPREHDYLCDMRYAAQLALDFIEGTSWEDFQANLMQQAAVTRQLEIVGEAARRISPETQDELPQIPWRQIVGMRNRIAHEYDRLNLKRLWDTATLALPELIQHLDESLR